MMSSFVTLQRSCCAIAVALAVPLAMAQPLQPDIVVVKTVDAPGADVWNA